MHMARRENIRKTALAFLSATVALCSVVPAARGGELVTADESSASACGHVLTILRATAEKHPEPILKPFGFKGGFLSELWQTKVTLAGGAKGDHAVQGVGLGVQSCLWSDAAVFSSLPEREANELMFALTKKGVELAKGRSFSTPPELLAEIFPKVLAYGRKLSGRPNLRPTFALNALVPLDFAAWQLYARANGCSSFDEMLPSEFRVAQSARHGRCASIPLITYGVSVAEVKKLVADGYFFLKIKIGQKGAQEEMLAKDCARISEIHAALSDAKTPWTDSGEPVYYFDANGRYETKETFLKFVDHLRKIGALNRTAMIEEPFDESNEIDVHDIPVRLVADESAHTVEDAIRRMDLGYRAMALKPIAKTLSVSLGVAKAAKARGVPCFCADLTVSPVMVEWNKAVAARLDPFPGIKGLGLVESNGEQNYVNWQAMRRDLPYPDAPWTRTEGGLFVLDDDYWRKSGGVLEEAPGALDLALDFASSAWNVSEEKIRERRNAHMKCAVRPVTEKKLVPPSGDRHDYMSIGPYWWPDPTKPDGKPYVRKDGQVNPEYHDTDSSRLSEVLLAVKWLTAAAWRLEDAEAGREAARRVRVFFLDPETRMNPNLEFGQAIPGRNDGRGIGIIDTYSMAAGGFLESLKILRHLGYLPLGDFSALQDWFARYLEWLETSKNGREEAEERNNHGAAYDMQRIAFADFCGKRARAREILSDVARRRIDGRITAEGLQPLEASRTKGVSYSLYQLGMFCRLAYLGECHGVDVWNHVTPEGGTIAKAVAFIGPYCRGEKVWPYKQIKPVEADDLRFCEEAAVHFARRGAGVAAGGSRQNPETEK